ncbi:hypothetical protein LTR17_008547 [Elasticomyces elasticus]|nr:hypothetical protein LTR17_008547 [Elasticomyces elasticus]
MDTTTPHPNLSGKSLSNLPANPYIHPALSPPSRTQPYKSWRKKYRKMRHNFDSTLEENKKLFKEVHKLSSTATRLREENDGLLDILLDLNASPSLPPHLRFNIERGDYSLHVPAMEIPADITPEQANETFQTYKHAVQSGSLPAMDLQIIRHELDRKLAAQETVHIDQLAASLPSLPVKAEQPPGIVLSSDDPPTSEPAYLTPEQESTYLASLDSRLGDNGSHNREAPTPLSSSEEKHFAEMTPRELERHVELLNPNSQHSWLAARQKLGILPGATAVEIGGPDNDNDSVVSHEPAAGPVVKAPRKRVRKPKADGDLAKRVGDKAVERAREEGGGEGAGSPLIAGVLGSHGTGVADDEDPAVSGGGSGRKKRDVDGGYHPKGGNTGKKGAGGGGKRKRSGEDVGTAGTPGAGSKKLKVEALEKLETEAGNPTPVLDWNEHGSIFDEPVSEQLDLEGGSTASGAGWDQNSSNSTLSGTLSEQLEIQGGCTAMATGGEQDCSSSTLSGTLSRQLDLEGGNTTTGPEMEYGPSNSTSSGTLPEQPRVYGGNTSHPMELNSWISHWHIFDNQGRAVGFRTYDPE